MKEYQRKRLSANEIQYDPEDYALPPGSPQLCKKAKPSPRRIEGKVGKINKRK